MGRQSQENRISGDSLKKVLYWETVPRKSYPWGDSPKKVFVPHCFKYFPRKIRGRQSQESLIKETVSRKSKIARHSQESLPRKSYTRRQS